MKSRQRYVCINPLCRSEIEVIRASLETSANPNCSCGAEMKKPYNTPVFRRIHYQPPEFGFVEKKKAWGVAHGGSTMPENFGLSAAAIVILAGAALLYDAASTSDANAPLLLLGAAVALAAGLITTILLLNSKLHWWRIQRQRPRGVDPNEP